jgi:hypothetical protein
MPELVDLLVLASSRKHGGRCVAGWDLTHDRWLRPVSSRPDGTLELGHCAIDGDWPQVFDVVRLEIDEHRPTVYQPENRQISERRWERTSVATPTAIYDDLAGLVDHDDWMLDSGDRRVDAAWLRANPASSSLVLVRPEDAQWRLERFRGDRQYKTTFQLAGRSASYEFSVTDPPIYEQLRPLPDGSHPLNVVGIYDDSEVFYIVSLGEPFDNVDRCFKLVAGVIEIPA